MPARTSSEFRILRPLDPAPTGPVFEAAPTTDPSMRVTVWSGEVPNIPVAIHPVLTCPTARGRLHGAACWLEDRPTGPLLSDLPLPLPPIDAARVLAQVADGLAALHVRGHAHGGLAAHRIVIALDGTPALIGTGVTSGTAIADLDAVIELVSQVSQTPIVLEATSAAEIAARLREFVLSAGDPPGTIATLVAAAEPKAPDIPRIVEILLEPLGFMDEVQPDIGLDETARGLFDRWGQTGSVDEFTEDKTEAVSAQDLAYHARQTVLHRLAESYAQPHLADRFVESQGMPCAEIKALIADEPLDPLPIPEGVPYVASTVPDEVEHTMEVTAEVPPLHDMHITPETTRPVLEQPSAAASIEVTGATHPRPEATDKLRRQAVRGIAWIVVALLAATVIVAFFSVPLGW